MELNEIRKFRESIRQLQRTLSQQGKSDAACCGITVAQCHTLMEVGKAGAISLVDLASILGLDTSTMSRTIDGMARADLIERKTNPSDRRYLKIALTAKGTAVFAEINQTFDRYYQELIKQIPREKQAQVVDSIHLLAGLLAADQLDTCCREEINQCPQK